MSPVNTGDDLISLPVLNVHALVPSATATPWNTLARSHLATGAPPTAGGDSPSGLRDGCFHRSLAVAGSMASRSPLQAPAYTTPSAIAGELSKLSPPSYVHLSA